VDADTREMLESIQAQISTLGAELHGEIGGLRAEMRTEIGGLRAEMRTEIGGLRAEMHTEIGGLRAEMHTEIGGLRAEMRTEIGGLRAEMRAGDEMTRRHFDIVAESLRSDIRTIAEGVAASTEVTLRLHHELKSEMNGRFRSLEAVLRVTFADLRREIDDLRFDN
jgi:hypothetical protein